MHFLIYSRYIFIQVAQETPRCPLDEAARISISFIRRLWTAWLTVLCCKRVTQEQKEGDLFVGAVSLQTTAGVLQYSLTRRSTQPCFTVFIHILIHMSVASCSSILQCGKMKLPSKFVVCHYIYICYCEEGGVLWWKCFVPSHVPRESNVSFRSLMSLLVYCSLPLYIASLCPLLWGSLGEKWGAETSLASQNINYKFWGDHQIFQVMVSPRPIK